MINDTFLSTIHINYHNHEKLTMINDKLYIYDNDNENET